MLNTTGRIHTQRLVLIGLSAIALPLLAAADPELILDVGDTSAYPGEVVKVPVYLSNLYDTIAGFNFWVQLDRPDIMSFQTNVDSTIDTTRWLCLEYDDVVVDSCVDSIHVTGDSVYWRCDVWQGPTCTDSTMVPADSTYDWAHPAEWDWYNVDTNEVLAGGIDTAGTLSSGWEWVDSRSLSGYGTELNVAGIADLPTPPVTPGIAPQENGWLIKLVFQVLDIPDSMTDRTANILVQTSPYSFSDPSGNSIGVVCDTIPDTSFFLCEMWAGETCLSWKRVSGPPYDSMEVGWDIVCYPDTTVVQVFDGSVTVLLPDWTLYGDADCSGQVDISDLVYMVDYMFLGGPPSPCEENIDCDHDNRITITDLICLVEWMFPSPSVGSPERGTIGSSAIGPDQAGHERPNTVDQNGNNLILPKKLTGSYPNV